MLNSEQRRERDTGDGQQGKMFLVLWELSFKKAEAFGYFRSTKVPRRRQKEEPEMITEQSQLERGYVEASNVDLANEMSRVIETQRAYQFAIRMIQTSDEIEGIVNSLR